MNSSDIELVMDNQKLNIYLQYVIKETGEVNQYNMEITNDDNPYKNAY